MSRSFTRWLSTSTPASATPGVNGNFSAPLLKLRQCQSHAGWYCGWEVYLSLVWRLTAVICYGDSWDEGEPLQSPLLKRSQHWSPASAISCAWVDKTGESWCQHPLDSQGHFLHCLFHCGLAYAKLAGEAKTVAMASVMAKHGIVYQLMQELRRS